MTAFAIQRNSDRMYLERWSDRYHAMRGGFAVTPISWCEDESDALAYPSMSEATMVALAKMPAGADWIVVPIQEKENR